MDVEDVSVVVSMPTCVASLWVPKESILLSWHGALFIRLGTWWLVTLSMLHGGALSDSGQELYPSDIGGSRGTKGLTGEVFGWGDCWLIGIDGPTLVIVFRAVCGIGKVGGGIACSNIARIGGSTMHLPFSSAVRGRAFVEIKLVEGSFIVSRGGVAVVWPRIA